MINFMAHSWRTHGAFHGAFMAQNSLFQAAKARSAPWGMGFLKETHGAMAQSPSGPKQKSWRSHGAFMAQIQGAGHDATDGLTQVETAYPVAARPGYKPPRLLSYFEPAVREGRAA